MRVPYRLECGGAGDRRCRPARPPSYRAKEDLQVQRRKGKSEGLHRRTDRDIDSLANPLDGQRQRKVDKMPDNGRSTLAKEERWGGESLPSPVSLRSRVLPPVSSPEGEGNDPVLQVLQS